MYHQFICFVLNKTNHMHIKCKTKFNFRCVEWSQKYFLGVKKHHNYFYWLFVRTKSYKGRALDSFWHRVSDEMVVINLIMCATCFKCQVGNVIPTLQETRRTQGSCWIFFCHNWGKAPGLSGCQPHSLRATELGKALLDGSSAAGIGLSHMLVGKTFFCVPGATEDLCNQMNKRLLYQISSIQGSVFSSSHLFQIGPGDQHMGKPYS